MGVQAQLFEYDAWVDKKTKRTKSTDECYTPPAVYEAVKDWVVNKYNLQNKNILRPFYPDKDYHEIDYDIENDVVIDNPPYSILKEIIDFYNERGIKYWLFCQSLTVFGNNCCHVAHNERIYYIVEKKMPDGKIKQEKVKIGTGFSTNLDNRAIFTDPSLRDAIKAVQDKEKAPAKEKIQKNFPAHVLNFSRCEKLLLRGYPISIEKDECLKVYALDAQIKMGTKAFGQIFLLNDKQAEYIGSLDKQIEQEKFIKNKCNMWKLSNREKEWIKALNNGKKVKK